MSNVGDDLKKVVLAGVGAMAVLADKSKELVEELSDKGSKVMEDAQPMFDDLGKKGNEVLKQGKVISEEMGKNIKRAIDNVKCGIDQMDLDEIAEGLANLSDDALTELKAKLEGLQAMRCAQAEPSDDGAEAATETEEAQAPAEEAENEASDQANQDEQSQ